MIICNKCGKRLEENATGILLEDFISVKKEWGYFSKKDGVVWEMVLCESCVNWLEKQLVVPVKKSNKTELI